MAGQRAPVVSTQTAPGLAQWMARNRIRIPQELLEAHPVAVEQALKAADGDPRRLLVTPDGAVEVHNQPVW